jgi:hypothetical protein
MNIELAFQRGRDHTAHSCAHINIRICRPNFFRKYTPSRIVKPKIFFQKGGKSVSTAGLRNKKRAGKSPEY